MSLRQQAETTGAIIRERKSLGYILRLYRLPDGSGMSVTHEPDGSTTSYPLTSGDLGDATQRWDAIDAEMARYEEATP